VRAVFFVLLLANLAFLAWAEWIDAPQPVPENSAYGKLPRLKLVNELTDSEARPASGHARKTALEEPAQASRCLSIGPFDDQADAARGASQLREKGFAPRQRTGEGEVSKGFWVYIGGLKTDGEVAALLRTLEQSHVEDAHLMPDTGDVRQVSVGLFSDKDRADRRAQSLQKLGLQPEVAERKLPATVFWMDVDVPMGTAAPVSPDAQAVVANLMAGGESSHIEAVPCPNGVSQADASPASPPAPGTTTNFRTKVAGAGKVP
jgi:SPOR domain